LGVIYGDGHVSVKQRRAILSVIDKDFALNFKDNIEKWSGFKARFYTRIIKTDNKIKKRKPQYVCYIDSIEASKFLKNFKLNLIKSSSKTIKKEFIKGFFDSEGHVSTNNGIILYNSDYKLSKFVSLLLNSLNITNSIKSRIIFNHLTNKDLTMHNIKISRESRPLFTKKINSSIKRKQDRLVRFININEIVKPDGS